MSYKSSLRLYGRRFEFHAESPQKQVKSDVCEYDSLINKKNKQRHSLILCLCRQTLWFMFVLSAIQLNICVLINCKHKVILVYFSVILKFYISADSVLLLTYYRVILLWGFFFLQWNIWAHPPHWGSESIEQFWGCLLFFMITLAETDSSDMFTHTQTSSKASYLRLNSVTADSPTRSTSVLGFLMKGRYLSSLPSRRRLSLCFSAFGLTAVQILTVTQKTHIQ